MALGTLTTDVGTKIADRWVALLALPGLVFSSVVGVAVLLGQSRWWDLGAIGGLIGRWVAANASGGTATLLVAVLVVAASAATAFVARALAPVALNLGIGRWSRLAAPLARLLTTQRKRRWEKADEAGDRLRRNRIALVAPSSPTWIGERLRAPATRIHGQYGLDLISAWPRLWLLLPETSRTELRYARAALDSAATIGGWSVLYLLIGIRWWPAAVIGAGLVLVAWTRMRSAAASYAELTEAAVDVHVVELFQHFAQEQGGRSQGARLSERFQKST